MKCTRVFKIQSVNPFFEFQSADVYGNISGQEKRNIYSNWKFFTLKQTNLDGDEFYIMFLSYSTNKKNFLVIMNNDEVNDATIENDDLISYSSDVLPFVIYFGISHTHNKIFDNNLQGLEKIENAFNTHLQNHPMKIIQEMNMKRYKQGSIKISDMGYFFTANQEIMKSEVSYEGQKEKRIVDDYFYFDNSRERNNLQIKYSAIKFRTKVTKLIDEFISILLPNNSIKDLEDPQNEKTKKLKALHESLTQKIDPIVSEDYKKIAFIIKRFFFQNLTDTKRSLNMFLKILVHETQTNIISNSYIYEKPNTYFPGKIEVPVEDFVEKYETELLRRITSFKQIDNGINNSTEILKVVFKEIIDEYTKVLKELGEERVENYAKEFNKRLKNFLAYMNTESFSINDSMKLRLKNGIMSYLIAISKNPKFEKTGIFRDSSSMVNVYNLNQIFELFSMDRDVDGGYAVKTPVFEILKKENR
jgi:hypothetical protein